MMRDAQRAYVVKRAWSQIERHAREAIIVRALRIQLRSSYLAGG